MPAVYLAAYLLLRRAPVAYALSTVMLVLLTSVGIGVVATTVAQVSIGIVFSTGQLLGLIGSWIVLGGFAVVFTAALLRSLPDRLALGQHNPGHPQPNTTDSARPAHAAR